MQFSIIFLFKLTLISALASRSKRSRNAYDGPSWMKNLPDYIKNRPITTIAIPGSHDSFAHQLDTSSGFSQNAPGVVKTIGKYTKYVGVVDKHIVKNVVKAWSITQDQDVAEQLLRATFPGVIFGSGLT